MLNLFASYFIYSGLPSNISYNWNFGSVLGIILVFQIITGISLGMHYTANIELSFNIVEHIMRDIEYGWLIRYLHANGASLFFLFVYLHIGRGLYAGSYVYPRYKLWNIGVIIYILMMGNDFALNLFNNINFNDIILLQTPLFFILPRIKANKRIGPHNIDILSILVGSLLGDGTLYRYKNNFRFRIKDSNKHYLYWLYNKIKKLGYTNTLPFTNNRLKSKTYYFYTYTFTSFIYLYNLFYINNNKIIPSNISMLLTPLALAIWIMDDGAVQKHGLILCTHCFTYNEVQLLVNALIINFNLKVTINKAGKSKNGLNNQYRIRISQSSMENLYNIVKDYMCPNMLYKLHK